MPITRLKIVLQSKLILIIIITITTIYVGYQLKNLPHINEQNIEYTGQIQRKIIDGNKITLYLNNTLVYYYAKTQDELSSYEIGDTIKIVGLIKEPIGRRNFNLFDYRKYLLSIGIDSVIEADKVTKLSSDCHLLFKLKKVMVDRVDSIDESGYMSNFILGDNSKLDSETFSNYRSNGISHLFSISGMHITLFASIIYFLINKIYNSKKNFIVVFLILLIYAFITGGSPSIIRGVGFFLVLNINKYFNLNLKTTILFIYFLCLMLLFNPYLIYHTGFLFSYIISFYLVLFSDYIAKFKSYFGKLFITSLIAFLVSIPILIQTNFEINFLSIMLNLFFVPFVSFIIFPVTLVTFVFPCIYPVLSFFENIMESISNEASYINFFTIVLCRVPYYIAIIYYMIITFILHQFTNNEYKYIVGLIVVLLIHHYINMFDSKALISMIDVGQGDSILIKLPYNKGNILVDTGGIVSYSDEIWKTKKQNSIAKNTIIPYLKSRGIDHLDYLILTHGDYDHIGEATNLVNNFKVNHVIFNSGHNNDLEKNIIKLLNRKEISYTNISHGVLNISGYYFNFINDSDSMDENEDSLVFYTNIYDKNIFFTGDSGIETEKFLLSEYNLPQMDILKVGHHGSKNSTSDLLINQIKPKCAIISAGINNRFGHPSQDVLNKLDSNSTYITSINGMVEIYINKFILVNTVR